MLIIQEVLRQFGITHRYKGLEHVAFAIELAVANSTRLEAVIKEIYMQTAAHYGCRWTAVERNIRTVSTRAWQVNPQALSKLAGYPLSTAPTASEFIEIFANFFSRQYRAQSGTQKR